MAERGRGIRSTRSVESIPFSGVPTRGSAPKSGVSLRPLKEIARRFSPKHPFRVLILEEPDELSWEEYSAKMPVWFRLVSLQEG